MIPDRYVLHCPTCTGDGILALYKQTVNENVDSTVLYSSVYYNDVIEDNTAMYNV